MVNWDDELRGATEKVDTETQGKKNVLTLAFAFTVLLNNARKEEVLSTEDKAEMIGSEMLKMVNDMGYDLVKIERER